MTGRDGGDIGTCQSRPIGILQHESGIQEEIGAVLVEC